MRTEALVFCDDCPDRDRCNTAENRCEFMHWLKASTDKSGVPFKVTDPAALANVDSILTAHMPSKQ